MTRVQSDGWPCDFSKRSVSWDEVCVQFIKLLSMVPAILDLAIVELDFIWKRHASVERSDWYMGR
jgi:hypothetical protein